MVLKRELKVDDSNFDQFDDLKSKAQSDSQEKGFGGFSDLLKKIVVTGASAMFLTEDTLKGLVKDFKIPKELIQGIVSSAKTTKEDFVEKVSEELSKQIRKIDLSKEFFKFLENHNMDINLKIKFSAKDPSESEKSS